MILVEIYNFVLLIITVLQQGIYNSHIKFECQSPSFQRDIELAILCYVKKFQVTFLFTFLMLNRKSQV